MENSMSKDFKNNPHVQDENGNNMVKRYVHQTLTGEHAGIHYKIMENGRVTVTGQPEKVNDELVYDEVTMPASLIFKLATLLRATRNVTFVAVTPTDK